ncbi:SLC13 family permease [Prolixibacter sp. SD074]|uniref:SLC13 family permease n=1 Tax=Prolixibacter sp. SD074 TaxID=2652391 RepID=UPI0012835556|nr:ArsB/NhaD family transporter [Prolixibacter sp. SD074]GET28900.1 arsenical pump family protein [Prolixibacter sp. SD074]
MTEFLSWHLDTIHIITTLVIFILTFVFITTETLPNAIAAMVGAFLLVAFHIINQEEAIDAIDFETIGLLSGMMMTVAVMRKSGLFEYIAIKSIKLTGGSPWRILVVLSIVTAILSAFLDNVTTVLIIVPLTFAVADTLKINPMPLLISEILFSNIGGAATLIGDPPNIMIGGATNLDFMDFIQNNTPVILVVSVVTFFLLRLIYHKKLAGLVADKEKIQAFDEKRAIQNKRFFYTTLTVFLVIITLFITHQVHKIDLATLAIGGGFTMMMVTKQDPGEILKEVEWATLFFFIGLFIIIGGLEKTGVISFLADKMVEVTHGEVEPAAQLVLWMSALSTTFINSIPYTATMISVIQEMAINPGQSIEPVWWALSLGACLGGNGTLIGAAANIIVAGFTQKTPYPIKFKEYFKIGFPLMLVSIVITSLYLYIRYF